MSKLGFAHMKLLIYLVLGLATLGLQAVAIGQIVAFGDSITDDCTHGAKQVVDEALNTTKVSDCQPCSNPDVVAAALHCLAYSNHLTTKDKCINQTAPTAFCCRVILGLPGIKDAFLATVPLTHWSQLGC